MFSFEKKGSSLKVCSLFFCLVFDSTDNNKNTTATVAATDATERSRWSEDYFARRSHGVAGDFRN